MGTGFCVPGVTAACERLIEAVVLPQPEETVVAKIKLSGRSSGKQYP